MQLTASTTFSDLLQEVERFWTPLPDKPEETPERLLSALWSTACAAPVSADRAVPAALPVLDEAGPPRLRGLIGPKKGGAPPRRPTRRQTVPPISLPDRAAAPITAQENATFRRAAPVKN